MPGPEDVIPDPVPRYHRKIIRQARVPDPMVVRRDVVGVRERLDLRRLRVVKNAVTAEARKTVVILEHDYEHVIELRDGFILRDGVMVIFARKGLRSRHANREGQDHCQAVDFHDLSPSDDRPLLGASGRNHTVLLSTL